MRLPDDIQIPKNIRPSGKKTRFYVDNEILEIYGLRLKPHGIALYNVLARHSNSETQSCYPSYPRLMKLSGIGKRSTISKYLRILESLGLISVFRNKERKPNIYFLLKIDSTQKDTMQKEYVYTQKEHTQYLNSKLDSSERDTLNHITNSNKESKDSSLEEEDLSFKEAMKGWVPPWERSE